MKADKKFLRVGIAGYGVVGKRRRTVIDAHPWMKTVAVSDKNLKGCSLEGPVRYYINFKELLSEDIDVLFVSLPNYLAPKVTILGLEKGLHVFCEKPPGKDVSDIKSVIEVEKKHPRLKLKYGFNHRYHHSVQAALGLIESGEFGDVINLRGVYGKSNIVNFESEWRTERKKSGGGILLDQGIHMLDLMRLFGGEFDEIYSFISNNYWQHDVEDNAYALMRTSSDVVASIHSTATQWRHQFRLEITLQRGLIVLTGILSGSKSYGDEELIIVRKNDAELGVMSEERKRFVEDPSWQEEVNEFATAIREDRPIVQGASTEALKTMELVYRIYRADARWAKRYSL